MLFNDAVKGYDYTASMADEVMSRKRCSNDTDREEQKYWEKTPSQVHNIHHKSQVELPGIQTGPPRRRQHETTWVTSQKKLSMTQMSA